MCTLHNRNQSICFLRRYKFYIVFDTKFFNQFANIFCISTCSYKLSIVTFVRQKNKFNFTISCLVFILIYVIILILFLLSYFAATFLDIIALESIQIQGSIFNSSILCSFITFIVISVPFNLILYKVIINVVRNIKKELHQ